MSLTVKLIGKYKSAFSELRTEVLIGVCALVNEPVAPSANSLNLPPIVDVGEDRTVNSESDGTAIVLLDGSRSYDPDGHITTWSWENESGKIISDNSQVRVKLPRGVHIFYLTIVDDKGSSSKATLTIRVI